MVATHHLLRVERSTSVAIVAAFAVALSLLVVGCGGGDEELTTEEQLEKLAGRTLTSSEVEDRLALADMICAFDGRMLTEIWTQLDARQLEFQDWVFGQHCPARLPDYEAARPETGVVDPAILRTTTTAVDRAVMADAADLLESVDTSVPSDDDKPKPGTGTTTP